MESDLKSKGQGAVALRNINRVPTFCNMKEKFLVVGHGAWGIIFGLTQSLLKQGEHFTLFTDYESGIKIMSTSFI